MIEGAVSLTAQRQLTVEACAEVLALRGHHDAAHVSLVVDCREEVVVVVVELQVRAVQLLRSVQHEVDDVASALHLEGLVLLLELHRLALEGVCHDCSFYVERH